MQNVAGDAKASASIKSNLELNVKSAAKKNKGESALRLHTYSCVQYELPLVSDAQIQLRTTGRMVNN